MKSTTVSAGGRTKARRNAVQILYQQYMTGKTLVSILDEFCLDDMHLTHLDKAFFDMLLSGIETHQLELGQYIEAKLDRPINQLDPIERAVLYIGCYELVYVLDIPWKVSVNEAVELANFFGADQSYKYINGVLDQLARDLRNKQ